MSGANKDPIPPGPTAPTTPDACDSTMVLDAVATLRGEMLFFKDRYFRQLRLKRSNANF